MVSSTTLWMTRVPSTSRWMCPFVATLGILLLASGQEARAATRSVPGDFSTIQAAIDASADGDVVRVAPGVYFENLDFSGKAITVSSREGPDSTVIDGALNGAVVRFSSGEDSRSVLRGFTLQNGSGELRGLTIFGGGILIDGSPRIEGNVIVDNQAELGGGVAILGGSPWISGNVIEGNDAAIHGGGIHVGPGSFALVEGNSIAWNMARRLAGGIYSEGSASPVIRANHIFANTASTGGGIVAFGPSSLWIEENRIRDNFPSGVVLVATGEESVVAGNRFHGHRDVELWCVSCDSLVLGNRLSGSAINGAIGLLDSESRIVSNVISHNISVGSILNVERPSDVVIAGCLITDNHLTSGGHGGGIVTVKSGGRARLLNNTIAQNSATVENGKSAVAVTGNDARVEIENCIL